MTRPPVPMSRLGFGVSGPHANFTVPRSHTIHLIQTALSLGINTFDTAPLYGAGEAEARLGQAIRDTDRSKLVLISKAGVPVRGQRDFTPDGIERSLDASLERLGADHLNVLLLQGIAPEELTDAVLNRLQQVCEDGRCLKIGISGRGDEVKPPLVHELFSVIMTPVHAGISRDRMDWLSEQLKSGRQIIAIEALSAAYRPARLPQNPADLWYLARQTFKRRSSISGTLPADEALNWPEEQGLSTCTLFLTTRMEHLKANAALASLDGKPGDA